jgi:transposase
VDVGKQSLWAACRWDDGRFERPWRAENPTEIPVLVALVKRVSNGRKLVVAMESSGTYGDPLRQALADHGLEVRRVGNKASHDYAEVFDGVPSQHDGKDAAVVAELAALGKSTPWDFRPASAWDQELRYWVEWMVAQRQALTIWQGRLEALLARHWPELTQVLKIRSVTLLRTLKHYGSPQALAADPQAAQQLAKWGRNLLERKKVKQMVVDAGSSVGVRTGEWQRRQVQEYAQQALAARADGKRAERQLRRLAAGHLVLQAQGRVVGVPTACVLWTSAGDPRNFYAAAAYRKALGLNLKERSSGKYQGRLRLTKRGSPRARQWLYFAVLRLVQRCGVRHWYEARKARDPDHARKALVAVMRKLALALYHVAVDNEEFKPRRLFGRIGGPIKRVSRTRSSGQGAEAKA